MSQTAHLPAWWAYEPFFLQIGEWLLFALLAVANTLFAYWLRRALSRPRAERDRSFWNSRRLEAVLWLIKQRWNIAIVVLSAACLGFVVMIVVSHFQEARYRNLTPAAQAAEDRARGLPPGTAEIILPPDAVGPGASLTPDNQTTPVDNAQSPPAL